MVREHAHGFRGEMLIVTQTHGKPQSKNWNGANLGKTQNAACKSDGFSTVDGFVLKKPPISPNRNSFQRAARHSFNINRLKTTNLNRFQ